VSAPTTHHFRELRWNQPLPWALAAMGVALAAMLAIDKWKLMLAGAGGLVVAGVVVQQPILGVYLLAATVPLDAAGRIADLLESLNLSLAKLAALLTLGAWSLHLATRRLSFVWAPELTLLCVYLGFGVLSLADTREFDLGRQAVVRFASAILFYLVVVNLVRTREQLRRAVGVLVVVSVLTFGFAVAQRYMPSFVFANRTGWEDAGAQTFGVEEHRLDAGRFGTVARSSGVAYHAIVNAVNTAIVLPVLLASLLFLRRWWQRSIVLGGALITLAGNLVTYSRTGLLLLMLSFALVAVRGIVRVTPLHLAGGAILAAVAFFALPESLTARVFSLESYTVSGSESLRHRLDLYSAGFRAFLDHPLNGMGMETTYRIFDYYDYPDKETIITVHNGYLQVALELGIPGLVTLLLFLTRTGRSFAGAASRFRARGEPGMAVLCEALLIGFAMWLIAGFTIDFMRIGFKNVWFLMALAPVLLRFSREPLEAAPGPARALATT
jgi:O-antigen ligase